MDRFIYKNYEIGEDWFEYLFTLGEYVFRPKWTVGAADGEAAEPTEALLPLPKDDPVFRRLVFNLGMAELVSYWKCVCPKEVEVCEYLDDSQKAFWKKLYRLGLGEFFYKNGITPEEDFISITATGRPEKLRSSRKLESCLVPVGGGKDSVVTIELLRGYGDNLGYIIGDIKRARDCAGIAGIPVINPARTIDPTLLELNRRGFLNGHTPFSAVVAFSGVLFAYLTGKKYVVLSNESSANEGNTADNSVNHQYSKSAEFEGDFREYISRDIENLPEYFSLLRPLTEYKITEMFSKLPRYFGAFQSCNAGVKTNAWCNKCAKCLYVYIMLSAFLDDSALLGIFGENLLENPDFAGLLEQLADPKYDKPFECVGTRDEVNFALYKSLERRKNNPPRLLARYAGKIIPPNYDVGAVFGERHFIPGEFLELLKKGL